MAYLSYSSQSLNRGNFSLVLIKFIHNTYATAPIDDEAKLCMLVVDEFQHYLALVTPSDLHLVVGRYGQATMSSLDG